jgi:shikimate kinase
MPLGSAETLSLAGMMAAGKTTVARALGRLLGRRVVSTDERVEALAGKPIPAIFAEDGEPFFRALERGVVGSVRGPVVVDLGGGAFCDPEIADRLLRIGKVVFLDVSPAEARRRAGSGAERPLLPRWEALLSRRLGLYLRASIRVEVGGLEAEAVARRVLGLLGEGP